METNLRCSICNKVNNAVIETNRGDYIRGKQEKFFPDPKYDEGFICIECKSEIDLCREGFYLMDLEKLKGEL